VDRVEEAIAQTQAVAISTPPFQHYPMAKQAILAGKHIFLEKPATLSAPEARELYHLAKTHNIAVALDFEFRFIPAWQHLKTLLTQNYTGNIRYIKIDWLGSSRADAHRPWNWYAQKDQGGGTLGSIGSHAFDYIHWLFGPSKRLSAHLTTAIPTRPEPTTGQQRPVTSDDICNITLEQPDGTPIQLCLSAVTHQGRGHFLEIYGDQGTLLLGNPSQTDYINGFTLQGIQGKGDLQPIAIPDHLAFPKIYSDGRIAPIARVMDQWLNNLTTPNNLTPGLREGLYAQLLMDCTHQSHAKRQWVEIPDLDQYLTAG
jgi:predicted dehydrogenase